MDILIPKMADGIDSATVVNILVKEGDRVEKNQDLLELETAKAVGSVPSPAAGVVSRIHVQKGSEVAVGAVAITLAETGAPAAGPAPETEAREPETQAEYGADPKPSPEASAHAAGAAAPSGRKDDSLDYRFSSKNSLSVPASPSVRKLAAELGIDLTRVKGSEHGGRVTTGDVKAYIQRLQRAVFSSKELAQKLETPAAFDFAKWGPVRREKLTVLRRTISQRMTESWTAIPHVTQFDEADITVLDEIRKKYAESYKKQKAHLTPTSFVVAALARTLKEFPAFNASLDEDSGEVVFKDYYHVGIAVDTEQGLVVPVIRDADRKDLLALTLDIQQAADKARQRKLTVEDMQGGTFTLSNQGGIGGAHFTPIINRPEAAILGIGRAALKPVIREAKTESRLMMPLALSYDHRLIDGGAAARFITHLRRLIEAVDEAEVVKPFGTHSGVPGEGHAKPGKPKSKKEKPS